MISRHWIGTYELCIEIDHTYNPYEGELTFHLKTVFHRKAYDGTLLKVARAQVPAQLLVDFDKITESEYWKYFNATNDEI